MFDTFDNFASFVRGKNISILGFGVSNKPLLNMLLELEANVTIFDKKDKDAFSEYISQYSDKGVRFVLGPSYLSELSGDMIIKTPGMRPDLDDINRCRDAGSVITSEMELFFDMCPCRIIGITGSDGKTTTTTIIYEMLKIEGYRVHLGGNIGKPLFPIIRDVKKDDIVVVELSSFQLTPMRKSPDIAVIKNITPNHLDWHKGMEEYIDAKKNILKYQTGEGRAVLNLDDPVSSGLSSCVKGSLGWFSMKEKVSKGAYLSPDGHLHYVSGDDDHDIMSRDIIKIIGDHNVENYLTAISAVYDLVSEETIRYIAENFAGVEHRMEYVRTFKGRRFYNDAIGTSPTRTIACLKCQTKPIVLIAGGYDKHIPFEPLAPYIIRHVKAIVFFGKTGKKIEDAVRACPGFDPEKLKMVYALSMEETVEKTLELSLPGDDIYMSPASASFDRYPNFEYEGRDFKRVVNGLKE